MSLDGGAYGVAGQLDQETGWKVIEFEVHHPPPMRWGIIIGDAAHNLRSALDHLVYELSGHKSGTQFPISTDPDRYFQAGECGRKSLRDSMLKGVPETARTIIDNLQPFQRAGQQSNDPLAQLAWLNNADRHRIIHAAFVSLSRIETLKVDVANPVGGEEIEVEPLIEPPVEVKHGTPLYRIRVSPDPTVGVNVDSRQAFRVAFGKGTRFLETGDVRRIADYVREIIGRF